MSYVPVYTTKTFVLSQIHVANDPTDISDETMEIAEARVTGLLLENEKVAFESIIYSDFRLKMAATYSTLYQIQTTGTIPGYYGFSGDVITKGAAGLNIIYSTTNRGGGGEFAPPEIDRQQGTPDNWNSMMHWIGLYVKGVDSGSRRIDEMMAKVHNFQDDSVVNIDRSRPGKTYNP